MSCCAATIISFQNVEQSVIAYEPSLAAIYGSKPRVTVYYRDEDGTYFQSTFGTSVRYDGTSITVDHGGTNSGFINIS